MFVLQRYIYTACAKGRVVGKFSPTCIVLLHVLSCDRCCAAVYDVLTGEVVQTLLTENYRNCVRDVSWHPTQPAELVSTSVITAVSSMSLCATFVHPSLSPHSIPPPPPTPYSGMVFYSCGPITRGRTLYQTHAGVTLTSGNLSLVAFLSFASPPK